MRNKRGLQGRLLTKPFPSQGRHSLPTKDFNTYLGVTLYKIFVLL